MSSKVLVARGSGHHPLGALGSMVPARANQTVRFKRDSIKGTCPNWLDPSPVQSCDLSLVMFQGLESSPGQGDPCVWGVGAGGGE